MSGKVHKKRRGIVVIIKGKKGVFGRGLRERVYRDISMGFAM